MDPTGKMLWLKQKEPENFEKSAKLLDVKDWLIHRCTGEFTTTPDCANMTWMMDSRKGKEGWSEVLAQKIGIPIAKLPKIVDGSDAVGTLTKAAARDLGLKASTLMIAGGSDVTVAAIGSGAVGDGELHINASTSSWISGFFPRRMMNINYSYATISSSIAFRPLLVVSQENAGSILSWVARMMEDNSDGDLESLASFYEDIGEPEIDDPFLLPWFAGERAPVDEERLRGSFHGLSLRHDRRALKRAAIEGIALNIRWAYSKVAKEKGVQLAGPIPLVGGAALNDHFPQVLADALNRSVTVGEPRFAGVLGAAAMAAPALGWHNSVWEAATAIPGRAKMRFDPNPQRVAELNIRHKRLELIRKDLIRLYRRKGTEVHTP
jgi:xylulokinase